ncbi:MAG: UDP-N-acetylmuramoyl-L-alanine--D-glutamate ligase [Nitrospirae bacterium]|nr:UDP-N-acetylmuramoyl-L-alanine--D-glutamate ligase [Nitrospirota bacterium]
MDVKGKKVIVVGLARSGVGAANLLKRLGASVIVTDKKKPEELGPFIEDLAPGIECSLGGHAAELFDAADLVVVSPGVPLLVKPLREAAEKGVRIIGELELAWQFYRDRKTAFLAITGTNGKSTTTSLLDVMLRKGGFATLLGGNIGNALTTVLERAEGRDGPGPDFVVAEVSSFQLDAVDDFRPHGSAILNITPDHLDRYASMADYVDSKCRIFFNQDEHDFLVLNADDPVTAEIEERIERHLPTGRRPAVFYFSRKKEVTGAYYKNDVIHFNLPGYSSFALHPSGFRIRGVHNVENAMAASLMALLSGCGPGAVEQALEEFPGLEHRLEFVREIDGVRFINDSKGTNVGAVVKSLESFDGSVILIAGGRDKDGDFGLLKPLVSDKVKALILIGEAADKIRKALGDSTRIIMEDSLRNAVSRARGIASPGDAVLLSPACASFDMFRDFEHRGRQFKEIVAEL